MATKLSEAELERALEDLPGWSVANGKLHAEFRFDDFIAAFGFMTKVAMAAQCADHHPEWSNAYNRVVVDLVTHDADDAITERDTDLARAINLLLR